MPKRPTPCLKSGISIRPLRPDDWKNVETLFGSNGACGGCWCMWGRLPKGGKLWEQNKGAPNKRAFKRLVTAGKVYGCLAFADDGGPVGWCCIGPRADFPRFERIKALRTDWNAQTWSVTCFFIRAHWRRRGLATALLKEAVRVARENGARRIEAYPVRFKKGDVPPAFAWTGVPALFKKNHFKNVTPRGNPRDIYRRAIRK